MEGPQVIVRPGQGTVPGRLPALQPTSASHASDQGGDPSRPGKHTGPTTAMEFTGTERDLVPAVPSRFGPVTSKRSHGFSIRLASHPNGISEQREAADGARLRAIDPGPRRFPRGRLALLRTGELPPLDTGPRLEVAGVHRRNMATSLFRAVATARYSQVQFFLGNGVETDVVNDAGQNLLITSLYVNDEVQRERMFKYLLRKGVDPYYTDTLGRSVLSWACLLGRHKEALAILDATMGDLDVAQGDKDGKTPLHVATIGGHEKVVMVLLRHMDKYKLNVDVPDSAGLTPYIYARRHGLHEIAHLLTTVGQASPKQFDTVSFKSADEWAMVGARERAHEHKRERRRQMALHKMCGKLPPLVENEPTLSQKITHTSLESDSVFMGGNSEEKVSISSNGSDRKIKGVMSLSNNSKTATEQNDANNTTQRGGHSHHNSDSSEEQLSSGSNSLSQTNWLVDSTFNHLLDLQTELSDTNVSHPTTFVHSEMDTAQATELGIMGNLNGMMAILSDQTSGAFRAEAIPQPPTPVKDIPKKRKKKNVSTLAILLSGKRRLNGARQGTKPSAAGKGKKSLSDRAKDKKRNGQKRSDGN